MTHNVPVQSLIDHIKSAIDVDPWAKEMVENILREQPEIVLCKNCKHRPTQTEPQKTYGFSIEFPKRSKCPCQCDDGFYSWYPADNWYCANGERRTDDA